MELKRILGKVGSISSYRIHDGVEVDFVVNNCKEHNQSHSKPMNIFILKNTPITLSLLCMLINFILPVSAQSTTQRFQSDICFFTTAGSSPVQGFWLTHNRFGMFNQSQANGVGLLSGSLNVRNDRFFDIGGGLDILARVSNQEKYDYEKSKV